MRYVDGRAASKRLKDLFGEKVFTNPKDEILLSELMAAVGINDDDIVLDMFSGSGSALHAVLEVNAKHEKPLPIRGPPDRRGTERHLKDREGCSQTDYPERHRHVGRA